MPLILRVFFVLMVISGCAICASAQQPAASPGLNEILDRGAAEAAKYVETFKNLLSEETKTIETFDKQGGVKRSKTIRSTFLVYPLTKDQGRSVEFRNVIAVDGSTVSDADKRIQDFFTHVAEAGSSQKEMDQLAKESSRYDGDLVITGLTLLQSPELSPKLRPNFNFVLKGVTSIDGAQVYEIGYQQTRETPLVSVNAKDQGEREMQSFYYELDAPNKDLNGRVRGTIWIDTATFRVRREHRELTVQLPEAPAPTPVIVNDLEFQSSDFDILTPKRITHVQSRVKGKGEPPVKEIKITFDYANFSRPDVEIKSSEVKDPPKQ